MVMAACWDTTLQGRLGMPNPWCGAVRDHLIRFSSSHLIRASAALHHPNFITSRAPMRVYTILVTLYSLTNIVQALVSGKHCPLACETVSNYITFNDTDPLLQRQVRACRSNLRITSIYLCADEFCRQDGEIERWTENQRIWCDENANITLPSFQEVVDDWTADAKGNVRRIHASEALEFPFLNEIVIPDPQFFDRAYTTIVRQTIYRPSW